LAFYDLGHGNYLVAIEVQENAYQPRTLFMYYSESGSAKTTPRRLLKIKTYERDDDKAGTVSTKVTTEVEGIISFNLVKRVLFEGEAVTFGNPKTTNDRNVFTQVDDRIRTITPGTATGRLLGGNLTVLTAILGSPYVPDFTDAILFLEDVGEDYYRIDRMMTSLKLAGILSKVRGVIFGTCSECGPGEGFASFTPEEIFIDHLKPLGVPAWQGAMIGHGQPQWTLPVGSVVTIDAMAGTVTMAEGAVR
jgi:muramoyltetrapeptide carboxypeptidase